MWAKLKVERLEDRLTPYVLSGFSLASPSTISYSFMPDGTNFEGYTSRLFAELDVVAPTPVWQGEYLRALNTWAQYAPLDFHLVTDDGSPEGTFGTVQGDSRFGDLRLGTRLLGSNVLGYSHFPNVGTTGSTEGSDTALNDNHAYFADHVNLPDLYSVFLHETGHDLGLDHSLDANAVMYGAISRVFTGLTADDIAGIQAIYGTRNPNGPAAPAGLTATAASSSQINLTWLDNSTDEDGFRVEQSTDGITYTTAGIVGANTTTFSATNLSANTLYYFRVFAFNGGGDSSPSNVATTTTQSGNLQPDRFEPNDTLATAHDFGSVISVSELGLTLHTSTDVDWFSLAAKRGGNYRFNANGATISIFDVNGNLLATGSDALTIHLNKNQKVFWEISGGEVSYGLTVYMVH